MNQANKTKIKVTFDKCSMLQQTKSRQNHTSNTKVYVNEFVANVLHDNMGMIIFDLRGCGGC